MLSVFNCLEQFFLKFFSIFSITAVFFFFFRSSFGDYYFTHLRVFHASVNWWFSSRVLSDSKFPQVSRTLLSILADLNNTVVWMVSTRSLIFISSRSYTNPLVTVPSAPITISITITFMFQSFFSSLARSRYLSLFLFSFTFTLWSAGTAEFTIRRVHFFFGGVTISRSGRLAKIRWSVCISKFQRILCVSFSRTDSELCIYHLFVWSNLNFLHNSLWILLSLLLLNLFESFSHQL